MNIPKEPAVILGLVGAIVTAVLQVMSQTEGQTLTPMQWASIILPLAVGIVTRFQVVAAQTVKDTITKVTTSAAAVIELGNRVGVAVEDRPADAKRAA